MPSSFSIASSERCSPAKPNRSSRTRRSSSGSEASASRTACRAQRVARLLERVDRRRVGEEVAELPVAVLAHGLVEGHGRLDCAERLLDVLELEARRLGELLEGRLAPVLRLELGR